MNLIVKNGDEYLTFVGTIKRNQNKFYADIEVPSNIKLNDVITNIKGFYNDIGNLTLVYNKNTSVSIHKDNPDIYIYTYEANFVVSEHIDETTILIKNINLYYKELDYFFVEDKYKIDIENMDTQFTIIQKFKNEILFENDNLKIEYARTAGIKKDKFGHKIFSNPANLNVEFKRGISISQMFEEIKKIENCFGFVINKKMNLIEINVLDNDNNYHTLIPIFQKQFEEIILDDFNIVDLNSKQLLKDILKSYYDDEHIASAINMFYEYIYNNLDNIFEFTSLVNTLELVLSNKKYVNKVREYAIETNEELKNNNIKMNEIFNLISIEQQKFIKKFYDFENIMLRDKIRYLFYKLNDFEINDLSEKYISAIINTRNYYVHGTKIRNKLNSVNMINTKFLLNNMLYLTIIHACTKEKNILIETYKLSIPIVYDNILKYI